MSHSTYLLLLLLILFTEVVLLLIHHQAHTERTKHVQNFLDMENDKLNKKIEASNSPSMNRTVNWKTNALKPVRCATHNP